MKLLPLYEQRELPIPKRPLGNTGFIVPILSLGGQGSLEQQGGEANCIKIIVRAYELGIRYFDTSPIYGPSEDYYGEAFKEIPRKKSFLATKTDDRTRDGSLKFMEKSLKRLRTDYVDLWQIHHLGSMDELDEATKDGGALEALIQMQEQGVIKNLGITGHEDPKVLIEAMRRHKFDTILCPVNAADKNMASPFIDTAVRSARRRGMGVIGMKVFAQGYVFKKHGVTTAWEALTYAMSQPVSTVIVGIDTIGQLEENVSIAKSFKQLSPGQMNYIESLTKSYTRRACFFRKEFGGYDSKDRLSDPTR